MKKLMMAMGFGLFTGPLAAAPLCDDLGFAGLLMTDDIGMQALSGTVPERGAASMAASWWRATRRRPMPLWPTTT